MAINAFLAPLTKHLGSPAIPFLGGQSLPPYYEWKLGDYEGTRDGRIEHGRSHVTETMYVTTNADIYTLFAYVLGFATRQFNEAGDPTGQLSRQIPFKHPLLDEWPAVGIDSFKDVGYEGPGLVPTPTRYELSVSFAPVPYNLYDDGSISGDESNRYLIGKNVSNPYTDTIDPGTGSFYFVSGTPLTLGPGQTAFKGNPGKVLCKAALNWQWLQVPIDAVLDDNGLATNIMKCVGCVNNAPWNGYPKGTLLLEAPKIEVRNWAIGQLFGRVQPTLQGVASIYVDITLPFKYFRTPDAQTFSMQNPGALIPPAAAPVPGGWNWLPAFIKGNDIEWNEATTGAVTGRGNLFNYADFTQIFTTF